MTGRISAPIASAILGLALYPGTVNATDIPPGFVPIEPPVQFPTDIVINDMTPDAAIAVGHKLFGSRPLRWLNGAIDLLPRFLLSEPINALPHAITPDGSVIVGVQIGYDPQAIVWRNGVLSLLPQPDASTPFAMASDVSADALTIVGTVNVAGDGGVRKQAMRWVNEVMQPLPQPPGDPKQSDARFVSDDGTVVVGTTGTVIVGTTRYPSTGTRTVRWVGDHAEVLGFPDREARFDPDAMTPDGRVIVGYVGSPSGLEAARWKDGVLELLGDLPGGIVEGRATTVTGDGEVVFGSGVVGPPENCGPACPDETEAFVWTHESGMFQVEEWLRYGCGYDVINWHAEVLKASDDGTRLAIHAQPAALERAQNFLVDIGHCTFDYEIPEWITGVGDYYVAEYQENAIYRMHRDTGELQLVARMGGISQPIDLEIGPDGSLYVLSVSQSQLGRVDPTTGEYTFVTSEGLLEDARELVVGSDGTLYSFRPGGFYGPTAAIVRIDPDTGDQSILSEAGWLDHPALAKDGDGNLLTLTSHEDVWWVVRIDVETGVQTPVIAIDVSPDVVDGPIAYDARRNRLFALAKKSGREYPVLEIDLDTGSTTRVISSDKRRGLEIGSDGAILTIARTRSYRRFDVITGEERILQSGGHIDQPTAIQEILARCSDGLDNDSDGLVDTNDPGCLLPGDDSEIHRDDVEIDIEPRDPENVIELGSRSLVVVALLGQDDLDVRDLDFETLAFGPDGAAPIGRRRGERRDVDGDGYRDLLLRFRTAETGIALSDRQACLSGVVDGEPFKACDAVQVDLSRWCGRGFQWALIVPACVGIRRLRRRS